MSGKLEVQDLCKNYRSLKAVDHVSFSAEPGAICGVLGPNGAGKSTTLRMIVGILPPSSGGVRFSGAPVDRVALKRVGYLPEERGLYRSMTPHAVITYYARLKGMGAGPARAKALQLLESQGLGPYAHKKVKQLSKGMAQKVQILAAVAHDPDLVVLDEPFSGLDPVNQASLETLIRDMAARGKTVLFSTHVMEHAERMCDRIVLIAQGRKVFEGAVGEALALEPRAALLGAEPGFDLAAVLARAGFVLEALPAEADGPRWRVRLDGADASRRLLSAAVSAGAPLTLFEPAKPSLHQAFVRLVGAQAAPPVPEAATSGWRGVHA
jgi:ABC-2 type transport system ATP-binding protein